MSRIDVVMGQIPPMMESGLTCGGLHSKFIDEI